jgi:hypothetical protein
MDVNNSGHNFYTFFISRNSQTSEKTIFFMVGFGLQQVYNRRSAVAIGRCKMPTMTKAAKAKAAQSKALEPAVAKLEAICMELLDDEFTDSRHDVERQYWQRRFKNIVTPVSLALSEYEGEARFHQHYRQSEADDEVLVPVVCDPMSQLKLACETALEHCRREFVGVEDEIVLKGQRRLEKTLRMFLKDIS